MTKLPPRHLQPVFEFLIALEKHNNKAWFDAHRGEYEAAKDRFEQYVELFIDEFRSIEDFADLSAKACLFRINRDVRFSKDKSPYKTNFGASIALGGKQSRRMPYYIHLQPGNNSLLAGGLYMPMPEQINRVRVAIARDSAPLRKILNGKTFLKVFGNLMEDGAGKLKTAPKGYDRNHPDLDLLQFKQWAVMHPLTDAEMLATDLMKRTLETFKVLKPLNDWLNSVLLG
ncbi:MAG: DUF2461 domain-containing protein [Anaerolineae bacterium]